MSHYQKNLLKFENNIKIEGGAFLEKQRRPLPNHGGNIEEVRCRAVKCQ